MVVYFDADDNTKSGAICLDPAPRLEDFKWVCDNAFEENSWYMVTDAEYDFQRYAIYIIFPDGKSIQSRYH